MERIKEFFDKLFALPILAPFIGILYSRSVFFAFLGVIAYGVIPELIADPARSKTIGDLIIAITLLVSGRYSLEGIAVAFKEVPTGNLVELIRTLIVEILESILNPAPENPPEVQKLTTRMAQIVAKPDGYTPGRPGTDG